MPRLLAAVLAAVVAFPLPAGAADSPDVRIDDNFYFPAYRVVFVDSTVTWTNEGSDQHTVTFYDDAPVPYDSSPKTTVTCNDPNPLVTLDCIEPGSSVEFTFTEPGTYDYFCKVHSSGDTPPDPKVSAQEQPCQMCGRVVVREEDEPEPRERSSPTIAPSPTQSASPTKEPEESPSPEPTDGVDESPIASADDDDGGGSGGTRALAAFVLILALSGAGYLTWRKFLT